LLYSLEPRLVIFRTLIKFQNCYNESIMDGRIEDVKTCFWHMLIYVCSNTTYDLYPTRITMICRPTYTNYVPKYNRDMSPNIHKWCTQILHKYVSQHRQIMYSNTTVTCHPPYTNIVQKYYRDMSPNTHKLCTQMLQRYVTQHTQIMYSNTIVICHPTHTHIMYSKTTEVCHQTYTHTICTQLLQRYVTQHTQIMYSNTTAGDTWRHFSHNIYKLSLVTIWRLCTIYYLQVVTIVYIHAEMI
jgi:ribosomal protein S18